MEVVCGSPAIKHQGALPVLQQLPPYRHAREEGLQLVRALHLGVLVQLLGVDLQLLEGLALAHLVAFQSSITAANANASAKVLYRSWNAQLTCLHVTDLGKNGSEAGA